MPNGPLLNLCARVSLATLAAAARVTACLLKVFCGLPVQAALGVTFLLHLGAGIRSIHATEIGAEKGFFSAFLRLYTGDPDMEYAMVDGTIVKVHRHGQGAKGGPKAKL